MSYTEINQREGMPYGGMPYDILSYKLEETDPDLIDEVRGYDEFHDVEDEHKNYVKTQLVDWRPDAPYLESDTIRRDPAMSRGRLNLLYNGTRGSRPELPRHPELFYGFTGNDPRGADTIPRFDKVRGHFTSRVGDIAVKFGNNDDNHIAERPWGGAAFSYDMKKLQKRLKDNTKIFSVQKIGRPWGRNYVLDDKYGLNTKLQLIENGRDGLPENAKIQRFVGGDQGEVSDITSDGIRGVDGGRSTNTDTAYWRNVKNDQDYSKSDITPIPNNQVMAVYMIHAARAVANDMDYGKSEKNIQLGKAQKYANDIAKIYRKQTEDGERRPHVTIQDGDWQGRPVNTNLKPSNIRPSLNKPQQDHFTELLNIEGIVKGLREGKDKRKAMAYIEPSGARNLAVSEIFADIGKHAKRPEDDIKIRRMTDMTVEQSGASKGLEIQNYTGAKTIHKMSPAANQYNVYDTSGMGIESKTPETSKGSAPIWKSHTEDQTKLGTSDVETFYGNDAVGFINSGGAAFGGKNIRGDDFLSEQWSGKNDNGFSSDL